MGDEPPFLIILAGPNGAGKSTAAAHLLPEGITFVNADEVAMTLPGYPSRAVDLWAGRLVLEQMDQLERERASFAVETTLSSRSLASRIVRLRQSGYEFRLLFLSLPAADLAVERVAARVKRGGHSIPEETIRRRHAAGIKNFFELYQPLATNWSIYDTTRIGSPVQIASGRMGQDVQIQDPGLLQALRKLREEGPPMAEQKGKGILGKRDATPEEIRLAIGEAIYLAMREHKRQGVPVATMRDGKVVIVPPEEIVIPEEFEDEGPESERADGTPSR